MTLITQISFDGQCDEALELYIKAFRCKVKTLIHYSDAVANGWEKPNPELENRVYHSEIMFGSQEVRFCDNTAEAAALSKLNTYNVGFDTADEVKEVFTILSEGGEIIDPLRYPPYMVIIGTVQDRFGIKWTLMCDYK